MWQGWLFLGTGHILDIRLGRHPGRIYWTWGKPGDDDHKLHILVARVSLTKCHSERRADKSVKKNERIEVVDEDECCGRL